MGWYEYLDEVKDKIEELQAASRFPTAWKAFVEPAPADVEALKRIRRRVPAIFISTLGGDDLDMAHESYMEMMVTLDLYCQNGHTGSEQVERNRFAAAACEQLHHFLRKPNEYALTSGKLNRPEDIRLRNLSYRSGADSLGLAYWRVSWTATRVPSEPLNPATLADFNLATFALDGSELQGETNPTHDTDDDESTEVDFT